MSKKKELSPKEAALAHLTKLRASVGKRCEYNARTHSGKGKISEVYDGGRGAWVTVQPAEKDAKPVTVRASQVALY